MPKATILDGDRYLLILDDKGARQKEKDYITDMGRHYSTWYGIPTGNGGRCFSTRKRDRQGGLFAALGPGSFANCTGKDKLYVCGHGSTSQCGSFSAKEVAALLFGHGLRTIGLITFKSCCVGQKDFLDKFIDACGKKGIAVGYARGYTDELWHSVNDIGRPMSEVGRDKGVKPGTNAARRGKDKAWRVKVVSGSLTMPLGWGRHQTAEQKQAHMLWTLKKQLASGPALEDLLTNLDI